MNVVRISCSTATAPTWQSARLSSWRSEIVVFRCFLPDLFPIIPRLRSLLQPSEHQRADRYRQTADRQRYVVGRGLLRLLMGLYLNEPPTGIVIGTGISQKPALTHRPDWYVNVTHAGNWVLIAVGYVPIGIDVENVTPDFPVAPMLPTVFSPDEQQHILGSTDAIALFYQFWTRKEALLKATGLGVGADLPAVPCLNGEHDLPAEDIGAINAGCWTVLGFLLPDGSPAALAVALPAVSPRWYSVDVEFIQTCFPTV